MGDHRVNRFDRDPAAAAKIARDDAYLNALGQGQIPQGGDDELARLFLLLQDEVNAPMPEPPIEAALAAFDAAFAEDDAAGVTGATSASVSDLGATHAFTASGAPDTVSATTFGEDAAAETTVFPAQQRHSGVTNASPAGGVAPVTPIGTAGVRTAGVAGAAAAGTTGTAEAGATAAAATAGAGAGGGGRTNADELAERRRQKNKRVRSHQRTSGWFGHGLVGAAAATLIIAGGGGLIHAAQPGDALWGLNQKLFTSHAAVVELAATLEEADNRNSNGDVQGALELLDKARAMAQEMNAKERTEERPTPVTTTATATVTHSVTVAPPPPPEPVVPQTTTVTITPPPPPPPPPTPSATGLPPGVVPETTPVKPPTFPTADVPSPSVGAGVDGGGVIDEIPAITIEPVSPPPSTMPATPPES